MALKFVLNFFVIFLLEAQSVFEFCVGRGEHPVGVEGTVIQDRGEESMIFLVSFFAGESQNVFEFCVGLDEDPSVPKVVEEEE